jgi:hypothetical protein
VKIQDISMIAKHYSLKPIDLSTDSKRNPNRCLGYEEHTMD